MDSQDIIASAERLIAELWEAKKAEESQVAEEPVQDAPPCTEAAEDEVNILEALINADLRQKMERDDAASMALHYRIIELYRLKGADIPLWRVGGCIEGHCGEPECTRSHHSPQLFTIAKCGDGSYAILESEEVLDKTEENAECFGRAGVVSVSLSDLIDGIAKKTVEAIGEMAEKSTGPGDDDEEPLPPAAIAGGEDDPLPPAAIAIEEAPEIASAPVVHIDEYRVMPWNDEHDDDEPGLLRRAWNWLWRR